MALTVAVVQQYIPVYRQVFFERVADRLASEAIEMTVCFGKPGGILRKRRDSTASEGAKLVRTLALKLRRGRVSIRLLPWRVIVADLVVIEQAVGNIESHLLLLWRRILGLPTASWGHGSTITSPQERFAKWVQKQMLRKSDWFFAYTGGSARRALEAGFRADRICVLNNSLPVVGGISGQAKSESENV